MITSTLLNSLIAIAGGALAILSAQDIITRRNKNGDRKITVAGAIFLFIALCIIIVSIWSIKVTNCEKETDNKKAEKTREADVNRILDALHERNLTYDAATGKVKDTVIIVNTPKINPPLLNVYEGARYGKRIADSILITLGVKNFDNGTATNLKTTIVSIFERNGNLILKNNISMKSPETLELNGGVPYSFYIWYEVNNVIETDTNFIYFKLDYTDKDGKPQKPLRRVFPLPYPKEGALIFDVTEEEFNKIKKFLVKNNKW